MNITKTLKEKKDLYIEFSEEEIKDLGWKYNQKFSIKIDNEGVVTLTPWVDVELDIDSWPKEILSLLVQLSSEQDKSVNEIIVDLLAKKLSTYSDEKEILLNE